jgi:hypothetical protein
VAGDLGVVGRFAQGLAEKFAHPHGLTLTWLGNHISLPI